MTQKILHLITGLGNGGAESVLSRLVINENLNQHVIVSMTDEGKYGQILKKNLVDVYSLNMPRGRISLKGVFKFYKILKKTKPNIVQTWMYHADLFGGLICFFIGMKNIYWNIRGAELHKTKTKLLTRLVVKVNAILSKFIPKKICSCSLNSIYVHESLGYKKIFTYIPNGIDTNIFKQNNSFRFELRKHLGLSNKDFLIGMVARYSQQKNHKILIESLSKIIHQVNDINVKCILVGKELNTNNKEIMSIISHYKLDDYIYLYDESSNIPQIMNGIDLHVLSSTYGEGFPNVLAEAMACGTPCVATNVGDSKLILNDEKAIARTNNSIDLCNAINEKIKIYKDKKKWNYLCDSSRLRIQKNYNLDMMTKQYLEFWKN